MAHQESNHPTLRTCSAGLGPHPHAVTHLGLVTAGAALGKVTEGVEEGCERLQRVTAAASDSDRIADISAASGRSTAAAAAEEGNDRHGVNCAIAKGRAADRGGMLRYCRAGTAVIISLRSTSGVVRWSTLAGGVAGATAAIAGMAMTAAAGGRADRCIAPAEPALPTPCRASSPPTGRGICYCLFI